MSIDKGKVLRTLPSRDHFAHKWGVGSALVIAGSPTYPGAAMLASRAAGRAGAGIVLLATSRGVVSIVAAGIPEVAFVPLPETESSSGARKAVQSIVEHAERGKSVVIGPGLGDDAASANLLGHLFGFSRGGSANAGNIGFGAQATSAGVSNDADSSADASPLLDLDEVTIVVDADALNWLATQETWWERMPAGRLVLTPHPGELAKLTDADVPGIRANPMAAAEAAARTWNQTIVLKGGRATVTDGKRTVVADHDSPALATAGSGDVLAGTIGGYIAQGMSGFDAGVLAAYLGPRAGALVARRFGDAGVIATDLADAYAEELHRLRES